MLDDSNRLRINRLETGKAGIGVLFNPLGGQARKRETVIRQALTEIPAAIIREASDMPTFKSSIDDLLQADIDLLIIVAGDGTIQAILGCLFAKHPPEKWPVLAIVAGGTTNMTSLDVGVRGKPEQALRRLGDFVRQPSAPVLIKRPVLCVEQTGSLKVYGMFFAVGLIARGVKFSRSSVKQIGITGGIFTIFIILRSLVGMILGRHQSEWAPVDIAMTKANGEMRSNSYLFALVSTLDCFLLGIRLYWGDEDAPLHSTMVTQKCKHLWRSLWPLLCGRGHKFKQQDGYHSQNVNTLKFLMDDEFIIDGELYQATSQNGPLRISATAPVTFLVI